MCNDRTAPKLSWKDKTENEAWHCHAAAMANSVVEEWKIHTIHFWDGGLHAVLAFLARAQPGVLVQYHMVQKIECAKDFWLSYIFTLGNDAN